MTKLVILLALVAVAASAQTHNVALTWQDTVNPSGTTWSVYKASGTCASNPTFSKLTSGLTATSCTDTAVVVGATYCYYATATYQGTESGQSNTAQGTIPVTVAPPTAVTVVVH